MVPERKLGYGKSTLPWKQADSVHVNALLWEQLSSGVTAETHRGVKGKDTSCSYNVGCRKAGVGGGRGRVTPWSLS